MKKKAALLIVCLLTSINAFSFHGVERGGVRLEDSGALEREIADYLSHKLSVCSIGQSDEIFKVEKVEVQKQRVDNGIIDLYYTIDLSFDSIKNDVITNNLTVKILDSDFDNWRLYEEKLSFEIAYDQNGFCQ